MHKALHNPFKQAHLQTPGLRAGRGRQRLSGTGHRPPSWVCPQRPAAADRGQPRAPGTALCAFEAVLIGGIDAKVRTKVAGRPRRVIEGLAGCEAWSEPENNGEQRGKGEEKADTTVSNTSYRRLQGSL